VEGLIDSLENPLVRRVATAPCPQRGIEGIGVGWQGADIVLCEVAAEDFPALHHVAGAILSGHGVMAPLPAVRIGVAVKDSGAFLGLLADDHGVQILPLGRRAIPSDRGDLLQDLG